MGITWTKKFTAADNGAVLTGEQVGQMQDDIAAVVNVYDIDTDGTLAANSDDRVVSQKAIKTYVDTETASTKTYVDTKTASTSTINPTNIIENGDFSAWSASSGSAPDGWYKRWTGNQYAYKETGTVKVGATSCRCVLNGYDAFHLEKQDVHVAKGIEYWKGRKITFGVWVKITPIAGLVYKQVTIAGSTKNIAGTGDWEWVTVTGTVSSSATYIYAGIYFGQTSGPNTMYVSGAMVVEGDYAYPFSPKPAEEGVWADYFAVSTKTGWAASPTGYIYTKRIGKRVFVDFSVSGTSNANNATFTLPFTFQEGGTGICYSRDNTGTAVAGMLLWTASASLVRVRPTVGGSETSWTASGTKSVQGRFTFEIA